MDDSVLPPTLLEQILAQLRCPVCRRRLRASDAQIIGRRGKAWAMSIRCPMCYTQAVLFAVLTGHNPQTLYSDLTPGEWERFKNLPPISTDDVIAFHRFIQSYPGDFSEILDEPLPPE
jgi:hypothetical protein